MLVVMFSKTFQASHMTYIIKSRFICFAWTAVHEVLFPYSEKAQCFMLKSYIKNTLLSALLTELRELHHNQCYKCQLLQICFRMYCRCLKTSAESCTERRDPSPQNTQGVSCPESSTAEKDLGVDTNLDMKSGSFQWCAVKGKEAGVAT